MHRFLNIGAVAVIKTGSASGPCNLQHSEYLTTVALINDATSPLAQAVEYCLPLHAGPKWSVVKALDDRSMCNAVFAGC